MRIFASDVRAALAGGGERGLLARALLAWAVEEKWGTAVPEIYKDSLGKPFFAGREDMFFSLSHTRTHVLAAVSERPVGADIESLRPVKKEYERLFSPGMLSDFGYFGGWTLREAVFKLLGEAPLRSMDIRLRGGKIITPCPGVCCRSYTIPGCAVAAAAWEEDFPAEIEIVDCSKIWSGGA